MFVYTIYRPIKYEFTCKDAHFVLYFFLYIKVITSGEMKQDYYLLTLHATNVMYIHNIYYKKPWHYLSLTRILTRLCNPRNCDS